MTSKLFRIAVACALLATAREALAEDFKAGNIVISHPWSRATPVGAQIGAGYLVIENRGTVSDRVLGGSVEVATGLRDSRCRALKSSAKASLTVRQQGAGNRDAGKLRCH